MLGDTGALFAAAVTVSPPALDPKLDKHTKVRIFKDDKVCQDIGKGCQPEIFCDRE